MTQQRQHGSGSIRNRGENRWQISVATGRSLPSGKAERKYETFKGSKRDALARLTEMQYEVDNGSSARPGKTTVNDLLDLFLEKKVPELKTMTRRSYSQVIVNHLRPGLGLRLAHKVDAGLLDQFYRGKRETLAASTVRHMRIVLSGAYKLGAIHRLVTYNPTIGVSVPGGERKRDRAMSANELYALYAAIPDEYLDVVRFAAATGMRRSEILGLTWADFVVAEGMISVNKVATWLGKGKGFIFEEPKTKSGRRVISIDGATRAMLTERRLRAEASSTDRIFTHIPDALTGIVRRTMAKAGIPDASFKTLRHTHGSLLAERNVPIKVISERMGHSSIVVTLDIYSHVMPSMQAQAAEVWGEVMGERRQNVGRTTDLPRSVNDV
jgi:integrase